MKKKGKFVLYLVLFVLLFAGFYNIFADFGEIVLERNGIIFLGLLVFLGLLGWSKFWSERLFFFVSIFSLSYLVLLWYFRNSLYLVLFLITLIIYLISLPKKVHKKVSKKESSPPDESEWGNIVKTKNVVTDSSKEKEVEESEVAESTLSTALLSSKLTPESTVLKIDEKKSEKIVKSESNQKNVEKNFDPGKYVGSSNGTVYHAPTCNWAKRVAESRQVWFDSNEKAEEKGYKKHNCVK